VGTAEIAAAEITIVVTTNDDVMSGSIDQLMMRFCFQCEKLHSQKGRFLSAMRMAHTTSLDDTDQTIYSVRFVTDLYALSDFCDVSIFYGF